MVLYPFQAEAGYARYVRIFDSQNDASDYINLQQVRTFGTCTFCPHVDDCYGVTSPTCCCHICLTAPPAAPGARLRRELHSTGRDPHQLDLFQLALPEHQLHYKLNLVSPRRINNLLREIFEIILTLWRLWAQILSQSGGLGSVARSRPRRRVRHWSCGSSESE